MMRVTHIIDGAAPEDAARTLSCLLRHLQADGLNQELVMIGRGAAGLSVPSEVSVWHVGGGIGQWGRDFRPLGKILGRGKSTGGRHLVHAWSARAAQIAGAAIPGDHAMITTLADPEETARPLAFWPTPGSRPGVANLVCSSRAARQCLVGAGVQPECIAVIHSAVDVTESRWTREELRDRLHVPSGGRVLLTASPPTRQGGQFYGVWAAAILRQLWPGVCMIVPGVSREQRRIERLIEGIYCPEVYRLVGDAYTPAELLTASDALVFPAVSAAPTGWLTGAMAASIPIVASDVSCVRELVVDERTGYLCPPSQPHALAKRIRAALASDGVCGRCVAEARAWAGRSVSPGHCSDAYLALYRRLLQIGPTIHAHRVCEA